jgi:restriction system protein
MTITVLSIAFVLMWFAWRRSCRPAGTWRVRSAKRVIRRLRDIEGEHADAKRFAYLRKIDPFVFEEVILLCFQRRGLKVERTPYTRDGGLDGRVWLKDGRLILLQAKRYRAHIQAAHMKAFRTLVERKGALGLFVHTGRTGRRSWIESRSNQVQILSGGRLLQLLSGGEIEIFDDVLPSVNELAFRRFRVRR